MTPLDYEFLRKLLKERSGLDLSSDKQYLVESRLIPLARRVGLAGIAELVQKIKAGADPIQQFNAINGRETSLGKGEDPGWHLAGVTACTG